MKNRNIFSGLLIVFALICAYNVYFSAVRLGYENELGDMTPDKRTEWLKDKDNADAYRTSVKNSFSLGLDLQGGMFVTLEVGVEDVLKALASDANDTAFAKALSTAKFETKNNNDNLTAAFFTVLKKQNPTARVYSFFNKQKLSLPPDATDEQVVAKVTEITDAVVDNTYNIVRTRIDQFGVVSPNIQKQSGTNRILLELPGVTDSRRVRELLRATAKLEFRPTYTLKEAFPVVDRINGRLRELQGLSKNDTLPDSLKNKADAALTDNQKREKFKRENPLYAVLVPPDFRNVSENSPVVGYAFPGDTAKVNRLFGQPETRSLIPTDMRFSWTSKPDGKDGEYLSFVALKTNRENRAPLEGDVITSTGRDKDQNTGQIVVNMAMNTEGAKKWKKMTTDYLGKCIAIVLDNQVISYPVVQSVIATGSSQISGNFTVEDAEDMANILKSGALPAPVRIEGEEVVGPSLGEETVNKGLLSFFLSFAVVLLFMYAYYRKAGLVANLALLVNLFFIIGVSAAMNVTMTFPGIAGIILTMAMAVDANVLIYERIREELQMGKSYKGAVQLGFQNAFSAILDGNITTLITGVVLYYFGSGSIRGFAVTLVIGIITTLVSAIFVTRLILDYIGNRNEAPKMSFGTTAATDFFSANRYKFIANRKYSYVFAGLVVVATLIAGLTLGFKQGVDFKGGRSYVVEFAKTADVEGLRGDLKDAFGGDTPIIKTLGADNQLMITTSYMFGSDDPTADDKATAALMAGLTKNNAKEKPQILKTTVVGPTVAEDMKVGALNAVIFSILLMFLYILFRFKGWQFGFGATVSLIFNVVFVLGLFAVLGSIEGLPFSAEIDQSFIAALLTIVGYTINDTVVVFDRIRELLHDDKQNLPRPVLFNNALNQTLSRTVVTATTTLMTTVILFFFGGEVLQGFMFAMFMGILIGTFSSIFLASPIALDVAGKDLNAEVPVSAQPAKA
jgi:SecD/SecF fusion protein